MSWDDVRQASVVLEVIGIALLLALLITPAPKHAIVIALAIAAIIRSVCAIIPSVAYQRSREEFDHIMIHPNLSNFCIAFAVILRYLTVVKAAFTVSFTSPLLYLAIQHSKYTGFSTSSNSAFYRGTITFLCIGPFIWALPTILVTLPAIIHNRDSLKPMFYEATCTISNTPYQVVSLSLMILTLLIATVISLAFVYIMWRHVRLPLLSRSLGLLDLTRILRFGALLGIIVMSTVLYTIVMATWARDHVSRFSPRPMNTMFTISVLWEAATPILMFIIFGAQEEIFEVWASWYLSLRRGIPRMIASEKPQPEDSYMDFARPSSSRSRWYLFRRSTTLPQSGVIVDVKQESFSDHSVDSFMVPSPSSDAPFGTIRSVHGVSIPKAAPKVQLSSMARPPSIYRISPHIHGPSAHLAASSLRPPPRPMRSRSESPVGPSIRHPFAQMPSLTAFGNRDSWDEARLFTRTSRYEVTSDRDVESSGDDSVAQTRLQSPDTIIRPGTGETSETFGHGEDRS